MNRILIPVAIVVVFVLWVFSAVVIVREDQQAVVRSFNAIQRAETDAGLSLKLPAPLGSVDFIEKRVLATDPEIEQFILSDDTRLDVDYYVRYRITDPITYVRNTNDLLSVQQVEQASKDSLSEALRSVNLSTVLSDQRDQLLLEVRSSISDKMGQLGIDVVDIRIGRADFVAENLPFAFNEMSANLLDTYKSELSNGSAEGERLRATANQEARTRVAEANATAAIMRGEAEAAAARLLNAAHGRDVEFYTFWRSMQSYRESIATDQKSLILTTDNDFLKSLQSPSLLQ
ncbi:SPFH domain-containing protein [Alphaproteobacteria bacterium]|nr:SPFH domain-containing protein [Alphaproteobacteria bacterium]